jgi:hypothetical protein
MKYLIEMGTGATIDLRSFIKIGLGIHKLIMRLHSQLGDRISLQKKTPWSESASELYRPSDRRLSAKWLPIFADKECHVVSVTDPYGRILGFLDRSRYFSIK